MGWGETGGGMDDGLPGRARLVLESMREGVIIYDPDGRYEYVNPAARTMLSQDLSDAVGTMVHGCHPPELHGKVDELLEDFRTGAKRVTVDDLESGERKLRETMYGLWEEGEYLGLACIYQDVTDLVEGEWKGK